jgi:ELWxxDGT repeat protein
MDAFSRYIVAVADVGSNTTGDLEVTINPPGTGSVPTPIIAIDSLGFGTQPILIGSGDIDGFKATVPIGSTELTVDITDRSFDAAVVVWDTSGNVLGRVDNGNPRLLTIPGLTAGSEVIITVAGDHFDSSGTGTMVLDFGLSGLAVTTTTAEQDAVDFPASGGDLVNNTTSNFPLRMDSNGDIDSVYYAPQSSGTHTIAVGDFGNIVDPVVAIYDSTGARIAIDDDSGPDDDALLSVNLNRWERYVIAILDQGNNSTGDVELVINGPVQTTSISVFVDSTTGDGGSSSQLLDATGDVDHYRFVAPESASGNLTVDISPTIGLDVAAVLWDSAGNLISRSDSAGIGLDETLFTNSVSPGQEFYVSVRSSEYASSGNFDLDINFETVPTFEEIVFAGSLANGQVELLRSNGSNNQGTGLLKNVGGSVSSNPHELTVVGSELFFAATGADGEVELFKTKANGATARVKDFAGAISSDPHELTEYNGRLYFVATGADGETELMVSNGTNSGTVRVKDLSGATSSDPADLTVMNGLLYFTAFDTVGQRELYVSDGTGPGTRRVLNLYGNGTSADPKELTVVGNTLFFTANTPAGGRELHSSTGAPAGTGLVKDIPGVNGNPSLLTEYAGDLYYRARNTGGQIELWKSDGTSAGTNELIDLYGAGTISNPRRFTQLGGKLYFVARTPAGGAELHVTNGTAGGTLLVKDLHGVVNADPKDLTVLGSQLMFSALGADGERELYTSDGTNAGTSRLKDLSGAVSSNPQNLTAVGNSLYFSATTAVGEVELFRSDGTTAGTSLVKNLGGSPAPHEIVAFDINLPVTSPSTGGIDAQSIGLSDGDSRLPKPAELIQAESRNTDRILDNVFALAEVDDDEESEEKFAWTQGYDDLLVFESI